MGNWLAETDRIPVLLSPMAGVTDAPFRRAVRTFAPEVHVISEMVASKELLRARSTAEARIRLDDAQDPTGVQLAGRDPIDMAEAARRAEAAGACLIDINMGCPAKKVVGGVCGAALMREPDLAAAIVRSVKQAVTVPVTVKMRLGWGEGELSAPALAQRLEQEGVAGFSVHGRTRAQFYEGAADWHAIRQVVEAVQVPVLANGDIRSPDDAREALHVSRAQGILIGRASYGQPWLPAQISAALNGEVGAAIPPNHRVWEMVLQQYEHSIRCYGSEQGRRVIRKHLGWYGDRLSVPAELRRELVSSADPTNLLRGLARDDDRAVAA